MCVPVGGSAENEDANGFSVAPGSVLATDFVGSMLPSEGLEETAKTKEVEEAEGKEVVREEGGYQAEEASGVKTAMAFAPAEMAIDKLVRSRARVHVPVSVMRSVDEDESPVSPFATCALISANREETAEDVATVRLCPILSAPTNQSSLPRNWPLQLYHPTSVQRTTGILSPELLRFDSASGSPFEFATRSASRE